MSTEAKYIAADIGGTFIKLGIVDGSGELSMRREIPIDRSGRETVMQTLMNGIDVLLKDSGHEASEFKGIGVSSAGCINTEKGSIALNGGNVPDWSGTDVAGPLTERYGLQATVANDGNCVALAEAWIGAAGGSDDVICVVLGTGIGGGIISGGHLIEGARGFGGEVGHFPTHADQSISGSDWSSHYETYASTRALVRDAAEAGGPWTNGREVFEAAAAGISAANDAMDLWIEEIAAGIAGLTHIFDPEIIIVGGGVSAQKELLIDPLREKVLSMVMPDFAEGLVLKAADLGNDAGMIGAVKYFIDHKG